MQIELRYNYFDVLHIYDTQVTLKNHEWTYIMAENIKREIKKRTNFNKPETFR